MKVGSIFVCIAILIAYLIIPFGDYRLDDVSNFYSASLRTNVASLAIDSDEFIEDAINSNNPEVDYIVHPSTAVSRDGDHNVQGTLALTDGYYSTAGFRTGEAHGAIDSDVLNHHALGTCPAGKPGCDDTAVIAPISGEITGMNTNGYNYNYYNWDVYGKETYIDIKAEGALEGWTIQVMHISNIPKNLKIGDRVKQGDYLGTQCAQGYSKNSHMHLAVKNGNAKVHVKEWFKYLTTHSTITNVKSNVGGDREFQGWNAEDLKQLNSNPKYESEVVIPDEFKVR